MAQQDIYLKDATSHIVTAGISKPSEIARFYQRYFEGVANGEHVVKREFAFTNTTFYNRVCLVRKIYEAFKDFVSKSLQVTECVSIIRLMCPDFPIDIAQNTSQYFNLNPEHPIVRFGDFLFAFQVEFCFHEFLDSARRESGRKTARASESELRSSKFFHFIYHIIKSWVSDDKEQTPPIEAVKELEKAAGDKLSLRKFLRRLAKSDAINRHIGALPDRERMFMPKTSASVDNLNVSKSNRRKVSM